MLYRKTYLEVNLDLFHQNVKAILETAFTDFCFVLKANAYGHGMVVVARELNQYPAIKIIAVATLNEALKIKKITNKKILILGVLSDDLLAIALKNNFLLTVFSLKQAKKINHLGKATIFIKVDTGFHRLGKTPNSAFIEEIKRIDSLPNIDILGVYSHLRLVASKTDALQSQLFTDFCNQLKTKGINFKYNSLLDSIALTRYPTFPSSLPRIGSLMFGLTAVKEKNKIRVQPIQTLKTTVTNIINLSDGNFGYSSKTYPNIKTIATLEIGYADGLPRNIGDKSYVVINNHHCDIIGLLSMDQLSIDITNQNVLIGDSAIIFGGKGITLEALSNRLKTNKNELISKISVRVPKVYLKENKVKYILDETVGELDEY